jgi:hypothetical protein
LFSGLPNIFHRECVKLLYAQPLNIELAIVWGGKK